MFESVLVFSFPLAIADVNTELAEQFRVLLN